MDRLFIQQLRARFFELALEHAGIGAERLLAIESSMREWLRTPVADRAESPENTDLFERWYASIGLEGAGDPDYGVYGDPACLGDMLACFSVYSLQYLKTLVRARGKRAFADKMLSCTRAVDVGCGPGLTTACLVPLLPDGSKVYATNIPGTSQFAIAEALGREYGFTVVGSAAEVPADGRAGIVFASEYFEHFRNLGEHTESLLSTLKPAWLVAANSFNVRSIGHFPEYEFAEGLVAGPATGRAWGRLLRQLGYRRESTGFWNNRPGVYSLLEADS